MCSSYPVGCILSPAHGLKYSLVQSQLETGLVKHLPFVRVSGDEAVNLHSLALSNPVASSLCLRATAQNGHARIQKKLLGLHNVIAAFHSVTQLEVLYYKLCKIKLNVQKIHLHWHSGKTKLTCKSFWGFQSESNMMQVSAAVKLIPRPPALVHSRNTKRSESGREKRSIAACRRFPLTLPSMRSYGYLESKQSTHLLWII